jgi:hypothetical protein
MSQGAMKGKHESRSNAGQVCVCRANMSQGAMKGKHESRSDAFQGFSPVQAQ